MSKPGKFYDTVRPEIRQAWLANGYTPTSMRQALRHPKRYHQQPGFVESPQTGIKRQKRMGCMRIEDHGTGKVQVMYRANKEGNPYKRNDGTKLRALNVQRVDA